MSVPTTSPLSSRTRTLPKLQPGRLKQFKNLYNLATKREDHDAARQLFDELAKSALFTGPDLVFEASGLSVSATAILDLMISAKLRKVLNTEPGDYQDFQRYYATTFIYADAGAATALFDLCVALGLFADEQPLVWFTPDQLARIIHAQEDSELRAQAQLAWDNKQDPVVRFRALRTTCQQINDPEFDHVELNHLLHRERLLDSAGLGDTERARQWFVDGTSFELFDLLVSLIEYRDQLSSVEYGDFFERCLEFIRDTPDPLSFLGHPKADQARQQCLKQNRPRAYAWYLGLLQRYNENTALWMIDSHGDPGEPGEVLDPVKDFLEPADNPQQALLTCELFEGNNDFPDLVCEAWTPLDPADIGGPLGAHRIR